MASLPPLDHLLQRDARQYVEDHLGTETWVVVYGPGPGPLSGDTVHSALVPPDNIEQVLGHLSWDLSIGDGLPGFSQGGDETTYHRWSSWGVEPFVIVRTFYTDVPGAQQVELVEEFRLLFNLAYVPRDEVYLDISTGTPEAVARLRDGRMEVKRTWLRRFLAVKGMHLALFFQNNRHSSLPIEDVSDDELDVRMRRDDLVYELNVRDAEQMMFAHVKSFSKFIGKKLVAPLPIERAGVWPYDEDRQYVSFMIGVDDGGRPVEHTCESDTLANYFGKNPEAPHYLQPVHFRRDVLSKYYGDSSRYEVTDGMVHCGSLWGLRMDNDHEDRVVVHLGDLSSIPYEEQLYWRSYNIEPDGGISETAFQRGVLAQFADPVEPALAFRLAHERTNRRWNVALGWPLFKPLSADDQHNLNGLRVPLNGGAAEFDGQVLALAKAAIDSLNEKPIQKAAIAAGHEYKGGEPGIAKLVGYLDATGFDAGAHGLARAPTDWMKDVQWLRSKGSAHRKASDYAKLVEHFGISDRGRPTVMRDLLAEGVSMLDALASHVEAFASRAAPEAT
ncbi:MAG: hypothetical protein H6827_07820 [Planctomycetes bacterium]|nr:hypothetical protein [Planctomycetota bacterium]